MPGIYGIATGCPDIDVSATLAAMALRLKHHPWYVEDRFCDEAAGLALGRTSLGFVNTAAQPASNEDGSLLAVMEGEVYDYTDRRRALQTAGHLFRSDSHAELLLHGFEARGKAFFRELRGSFAAAIWERKAERLNLVNDRFGMKPLYYAALLDRVLWASEIKALLVDRRVSRSVNTRGVVQFFTFGQLMGEDTLFESVRALPAAAWAIYDVRAGRMSVDRYWQLAECHETGVTDEREALDRLDAAFKRAVNIQSEGSPRVGISLSGGLDSRTILGQSITPASPSRQSAWASRGESTTRPRSRWPGSSAARTTSTCSTTASCRGTRSILGTWFA